VNAVRRAGDCTRSALHVAGIERPALEDESRDRRVAEECDAGDAQAREFLEHGSFELRLFVRDLKQHRGHRHLPLLSCAGQWRRS
jgi:hypothetical protein